MASSYEPRVSSEQPSADDVAEAEAPATEHPDMVSEAELGDPLMSSIQQTSDQHESIDLSQGIGAVEAGATRDAQSDASRGEKEERGAETSDTAAIDEATPRKLLPSEARALHNERVKSVISVWARAKFNATYFDDDGVQHFEHGEGYLIMLPREAKIFMLWGNMNTSYFTLGCDEEFYWVIDEGKPREAYIGRNSNAHQECTNSLVAVVHPLTLLPLTGLVRIPEEAGRLPSDEMPPGLSRVAWRFYSEDHFVNCTVSLSSLDGLPDRVEITGDQADELLATASLDRYEPMILADGGTGPSPLVPHQIDITSPLNRGSLRIEVKEVRVSPLGKREINRELFDFNNLAKRESGTVVIDLDADCPDPILPQD